MNWLLSSSALSNLGDGIGQVAFPLVAAMLTRDPVLIAGLAVAQMLPWLLFGAVAGVLLDRVDRRRAMLVANVLHAVVVGALAIMVLAGTASIPIVYVAALLMGTAETVADSAATVLIPALVDKSDLESANSKLQSTEIVGQIFVGNPVGSLAFAVFAAFPFLLNTAAYVLAAILLVGLAGSYSARQAADVEPVRGMRAEFAVGVRWLRGSPLILRLIVLAGLLGMTMEFAQAQLVLYALEDLRLSEAAFGVFAFAAGVGGLAGTGIAARLVARFSRWSVLLAGIVVSGLAIGAMGLVHQPVLAAVLLGCFGGAVIVINVVVGTLRHLAVPDALLGRVIGVWRTLVWGAVPVGALIGGLLTRWLHSPSWTFVVSGASQVVIAGAAAMFLRPFRARINGRPALSAGADTVA
ncbi:MFS transporter [Herbihabitans rhizosphaerae]|uniref:MFS transporter n=1 Tax=Herbihabitans rhizosphaerae TaxID=1872711 RepID=UPI001F5F188A|nr:MFS transporter [Herbihabitans rhizosphaerae]